MKEITNNQITITKHSFNLEERTLEFAKESYYWLELLQEATPEYKEEISKLLTEALELKKIFSSIADKS
ncbi:MAG: hypothetical protein AB1606_08695 [Nitrospirota bacterium]